MHPEELEMFFQEKITSREILTYFKDWLDDTSHDSTSGNSFWLKKLDTKILIGNLFDDSINELTIEKTELHDFLQNKAIEWILPG